MNSVDPKLTALQFNECINRQDIEGLSSLMTEGHTFIDRKGEVVKGKETMSKGWIDFFKSFPDYKNTFERVESQGGLVALYGYATWKKGAGPDYAIWTAAIEGDLVAEWRIYEDTEGNRRKFNMHSEMPKCKITVLKRTIHQDLIDEYLDDSYEDGGLCECFQEGEEFVIDPSVVPEDFCARCAWAWADIRKDILTVAMGANMPGIRQPGTVITGCTDWFRPVIFKVERVANDC